MANILHVVPLILGQVEPDEVSVAVDAALHHEVSNFIGDHQRLED